MMKRPEKAPGKPKPLAKLTRVEHEWYVYDEHMSRIENIVHDAVFAYEAERVGNVSAGKRRKERVKAHKNWLKAIKVVTALNRRIIRAAKNGQISEMHMLIKERNAMDTSKETT